MAFKGVTDVLTEISNAQISPLSMNIEGVFKGVHIKIYPWANISAHKNYSYKRFVSLKIEKD